MHWVGNMQTHLEVEAAMRERDHVTHHNTPAGFYQTCLQSGELLGGHKRESWNKGNDPKYLTVPEGSSLDINEQNAQ